VEEELVWEETSTILKRGEGSPESAPALRDVVVPDDLPVTATWRLAGDLGRRYAGVSGDLNPIHMHGLSARLFGFPTAIVHGMWTKARCLAALDPHLPERFSVDVSFRKPILLPATVQFAERSEELGIAFSVRGAGKGTPHLDGRVSFS
jgi:acyl dehydratase